MFLASYSVTSAISGICCCSGAATVDYDYGYGVEKGCVHINTYMYSSVTLEAVERESIRRSVQVFFTSGVSRPDSTLQIILKNLVFQLDEIFALFR